MKNTLCPILFATFLLANLTFVNAQNADYLQQKDSLLKVIAMQNGKEKIETCIRLQVLMYNYEEDIDSISKHYNDFIAEAQKQNDLNTEGMIYVNLLAACINHGQIDKAIQKSEKALQFMSRNELWDYYYKVFSFMTDAYISVGQTSKALDNAEALYQKAKTHNNPAGISAAFYSMALVYNKTNRTDEAESFFRKCIETENGMKQKTTLLTQAYYYLFEIVQNEKRYDEAWKLLPDWENAVKTYEKQANVENQIAWSEIYLSYSRLYFIENNLKKAQLYCDLAENTTIDESLAANVYFQKAMILEQQKDCTKALAFAEKALEVYESYEEWNISIEVLLLKIKILLQTGKYSEVYPIFETIMQRKDAISNMDFHAQLDELRTQYEVDKITTEKEQNFNYFLFAAGIGFLLLVLLIFWIIYSRKLHNKNVLLVKQILENNAVIAAKSATPSLQEIADLTRNDGQEPDELFERLEKYMLEKQPYTAENCNWEMLANTVYTNESYLRTSIKKQTGFTVNEYITLYRLKFANNLLLKPAKEYTIEAVAFDSGFSSRTTFYEAYRRQYGLTPNEFRKIARNEK
jgi:AraC-like DNA-binding protein